MLSVIRVHTHTNTHMHARTPSGCINPGHKLRLWSNSSWQIGVRLKAMSNQGDRYEREKDENISAERRGHIIKHEGRDMNIQLDSISVHFWRPKRGIRK